jgi:hypothetical protein
MEPSCQFELHLLGYKLFILSNGTNLSYVCYIKYGQSNKLFIQSNGTNFSYVWNRYRSGLSESVPGCPPVLLVLRHDRQNFPFPERQVVRILKENKNFFYKTGDNSFVFYLFLFSCLFFLLA